MGWYNSFLKKLSFLYIYLNKKIRYLIKTGKLHKDPSNGSKKYPLLKLFLRATVTNFLVYYTMVYIHQGSVIWNEDGSLIFSTLTLFELGATIIFLFLVFLMHRSISILINSPKLAGYNPIVKATAEALMVIVSSVVLLYLTLFVPFKLIFPEVEIPPGRVRFTSVVMAIISLFFYYFVERERGKKQLQKQMLRSARLQKENFESQLQSLKNQVNPHFLFNSLNVLNSLISVDQARAKEFTKQLSKIYRSFLDNSNQPLVPLKKEMKLIDAYLYLLKTRFGEAIEFELDVPLEKMDFKIPPGALQMLVENAVKHNGSTRKKPLQIRIYVENDRIVVSNNLQPRIDKAESTRTGLENIKSRYRFFSDEEVEIQRTETDFIVSLPLLKVDEYEDPDH